MDERALLPEVRRLCADGLKEAGISTALKITRHLARKLVLQVVAEGQSTAMTVIPPGANMPAVSFYDTARQALAIAKTLSEVMDIGDKMSALQEYYRRARDHTLEIDAAEIRILSERRAGEMLLAIKSREQMHTGGRPRKTGAPAEPVIDGPEKVRLEEIGVDKKFSARAQKLGSISERALAIRMKDWRADMERGAGRVTADLLRTGDKKERREAREVHLGTMQDAGNLKLPTKRYGVILADPEWKFETWSPAGLDRSADNHYATSETAKIAARPVQDIAAKDCVLFLWATAPMLPHALHVMAAWGFNYVSHQIWDKVIVGTGYWFRNVHELVLVGTRGDLPAPAQGTQPVSIFKEKRGEHSVKPEQIYTLIEDWFPNLPKIELNARRAREGWDSWGLEAPQREPEAAE